MSACINTLLIGKKVHLYLSTSSSSDQGFRKALGWPMLLADKDKRTIIAVLLQK